jgi:hypothetical protein
MNKPFFANFLEVQDIKKVTGGYYVEGGLVILPPELTGPNKDQLEIPTTFPSDLIKLQS